MSALTFILNPLCLKHMNKMQNLFTSICRYFTLSTRSSLSATSSEPRKGTYWVSINTIFIDKQNNTLSLTEIESGFLENRINRRQAGGSFHHFPAGVFLGVFQELKAYYTIVTAYLKLPNRIMATNTGGTQHYDISANFPALLH